MAERDVFWGMRHLNRNSNYSKFLLMGDLGKLVVTGQIIMTHGGIAWAKGTGHLREQMV